MKNVIVGEHAGFCFGAARGVESLEKALLEDKPLYTYGPILNNDMVVSDFSKRGVKVVNSVEELRNLPKGKVIIRSHGVPRKIYEALLDTGHEVFDATCPFVKRIHRIVEKESSEGSQIVVIGNPAHPEVEGIVGWSVNGATVIEEIKEAEEYKPLQGVKVCIVSQTTFNSNKFKELVEIFQKNSYNINVMNTICDATSIRQQEAAKMSQSVDVMIVIGDTKSSNSKKLYEICRANCGNTFFIQTLSDIKGKLSNVSGVVGITAGASTPKYIIEEVQNYVRNDF